MAHTLTNLRFGRLLVLDSTDQRAQGQRVWRCRCDCGAEVPVSSYMLTSGKTKSCGCLRRDMGVARGKASARHGEGSNGRETAEYRCWGAMLSRCNNPNHCNFPDYGARGIQVCERWTAYENFLADMGRRPSDRHSIDRIDVKGPYSPENCRWATMTEQQRNTRRNVFITIGDQTLTLGAWLVKLDIPRATYYTRLRKGMSPEDALTSAALE